MTLWLLLGRWKIKRVYKSSHVCFDADTWTVTLGRDNSLGGVLDCLSQQAPGEAELQRPRSSDRRNSALHLEFPKCATLFLKEKSCFLADVPSGESGGGGHPSSGGGRPSSSGGGDEGPTQREFVDSRRPESYVAVSSRLKSRRPCPHKPGVFETKLNTFGLWLSKKSQSTQTV